MCKNKAWNIAFFGFSVIVLALIIIIIYQKITTVNIDSDLVQKAYAYLENEKLDFCDGLPFYNESVTSKKLTNEAKMCLAYRLIEEKKLINDEVDKTKKTDYCYIDSKKERGFRLDEESDVCTIQKFNAEDLNQAYINLFSNPIDNQDFHLSGSQICYYEKEKGSYLCGKVIAQTIELGWNPTTYRMIIKAKEKGDRLFIYDYYLAINNSKCYLTNDSSVENKKCSNHYSDKTKVNARFLSHYGQKYEHTFKKDSDGKYHWVSSKMI